MIRLKKRSTTPDDPAGAVDPRFSKFSNDDLYLAFEQSVSHALAAMDASRSEPDNRPFHLETCGDHLAGALSAVRTMTDRL